MPTSHQGQFIRPPREGDDDDDLYSDDILFGDRRRAIDFVNATREGNNSECVMHSVGAFVGREHWNITNLNTIDKRIRSMLDGIDVTHALPVQRYSWPQIHRPLFPLVCIAPESTGKTFAHLLYMVSQCISKVPISRTDEMIFLGCQSGSDRVVNPDNAQLDDCINHPKYIVICSSQQQVDMMDKQIDRMKSAAYGGQIHLNRRKRLPPLVGAIEVHQSEEILALTCNDVEILIATPLALIKCLNYEFITFAKCKKVFFDDLDIALQLHNAQIREIIKLYLNPINPIELDPAVPVKKVAPSKIRAIEPCQMYMFTRKWTDPVKHFVSAVFPQRVLIFGSISEASLYANLKFELYLDASARMEKLANVVLLHAGGFDRAKNLAIVCKDNQEAEKVNQELNERGFDTKFLPQDTARLTFNSRPMKRIHVMSDIALDQIVDFHNDVVHIVHYNLPDDMLVFDQRFRLMYQHIKDPQKGATSLMSTVFVDPSQGFKNIKMLYDLIARSSTTLISTKCDLRDFICEHATTICWRWASTGLCRLERLSREDRFGSYCPDRHSLAPYWEPNSWPTSGQVKITITNLVSPSEMYFWFEAHRDENSPGAKWTKLDLSGVEYMKKLQEQLNEYKDTPNRSLPLTDFKKGQVYGIYLHHEARVDRIRLLEEPKLEYTGTKRNSMEYQAEYLKQCKVFKIDYGFQINARLENIFKLSETLSSLAPLSHRGFHLGVKPTDNEPNWLFKAKKHFHDHVCTHSLRDITVWIRLNSSGCFWFENMIVSKKLPNIEDNKIFVSSPHELLYQDGLAERVTTEPSCLGPSERLKTLSKWHVIESAAYVRFAHLRKDKIPLGIFVQFVDSDLGLTVRQTDFNKQLIRLEDRMKNDFYCGKLEALSYFAPDIYCLAKIREGEDPETKLPLFTINRCRVQSIIEPPTGGEQISTTISSNHHVTKCIIECLDHGDMYEVNKTDLYLASKDYLRELPFQSIKCRFAHLNPEILEDKDLCVQVIELLYDKYTRTENNDMVEMKCTFSQDGGVYLYVPVNRTLHSPLVRILEDTHGIRICNNDDPVLKEDVNFKPEDDNDLIEDDSKRLTKISSTGDCTQFNPANALMRSILRDIIKEELIARGVAVDEDDKEEEDDDYNNVQDFNEDIRDKGMIEVAGKINGNDLNDIEDLI